MADSERILISVTDRETLSTCESVLSYEAPFLIDKLIKERIVDTPGEGVALFAEVKKFLVLSYVDTDVLWSLYSRRVDEVWHQFVLFSAQYVDFCQHYFGHYLHHYPSNAPNVPERPDQKPSTFEEFKSRYHAFFWEPLPDIWLDAQSVSLMRRVINDVKDHSSVLVQGEMAYLMGHDGRVDVGINAIARAALEFISSTSSFYVRELPGDLTDDEKIGLVATLVEHNILRVAP